MRPRRILTFLIIGLAMLGAISCENPSQISSDDSENTNDNPEMGTISVSLDEQNVTASWVNSDVSGLADTYEILAYNDTRTESSGVLTSSGQHEMTVPADTYSVIVFAGIDSTTQQDLPSARIIGLGKQQDVTVTGGNTTTVSVGLDTFTWNTTWPTSPAAPSASIELSISVVMPIDTIQPYTDPNGDGFLDVGTGLAPGSIEYPSWTVQGTNWTGTASFTAPGTAGTYALGLTGPDNLRLVDAAYSRNGWLADEFTQVDWTMPRADTFAAETGPYSQFNGELVVESPTSGSMLLDVSWNPD